jgi:hypothetical protein
MPSWIGEIWKRVRVLDAVAIGEHQDPWSSRDSRGEAVIPHAALPHG